jgi:serine/threonine protein kinase
VLYRNNTVNTAFGELYTRTSTFKGGQHVLYMAPEGWKGDKNEIQIDMYSLGIVLYEVAALKYPYKLPADSNGWRDMHLFQTATPLASLRPDLPTAFCQVVARLMEKNPRDRFTQWQEVKEAVARAFVPPAGAAAKHAPTISSMVSTIGASTTCTRSSNLTRTRAKLSGPTRES